MSVVKPNNLIKQITTGTKHKKTTSKKSKQVQVTAQFRRHTSHLPYQIHFRSEVVLSGKLCRTLRFWLAQMKSVKKKTNLDTVPLPNNYVLLGTAHERHVV